MAPDAVVRTAGLTTARLAVLSDEDTWSRVQRVLDSESASKRHGSEISDLLFGVIGDVTDDSVRASLIALRRHLFNGRRPTPRMWDETVSAAVPPGVRAAVGDWLRRHDATAAERTALLSAPPAGPGDVRALAGDPVFVRGLARASTALHDELQRWLRDPGRPLRRRTLVGLGNYLSRAGAKTSPFSSFTTIALAAWRTGGPAVDPGGDTPPVPVVEIDRLVLRRLTGHLIDRLGLGGHRRVRVNPGALVTGDVLLVPGPGRGEPMVRVPHSPAVALALDLAAGQPEHRDLPARLAERTGAPPARARSLVDQLIRAGAVELADPVDEQSRRPFADLADWVQAATPDHPGLVARLREIGALAQAPAPLGDPAGDETHRHTLVTRLRELTAAIGLDWDDAVTLRSTTHETVISTRTAGLSRDAWQPGLDDLDVLRRWLGLHDRMLPVRIALGAYLARRFPDGAAVPLVVLHDTLQRDLAGCDEPWFAGLRDLLSLSGPVSTAGLAGTTEPRLRELIALRAESVRTVLAAGTAGGDLEPAVKSIADLAASWPGWVEPPPSITAYVQPYPDGDDLRLVVNVVSGGRGRGWSRWARLRALAGGDEDAFTEAPADPGGDEPIVAELSGVHGASVNLRVPAAPAEIDYPYTTSSRPAAQRIALSALAVRPGPAGIPELVHGERRVEPVHLGLMADPLLPPAARFLLAAFGRSFFLHPGFPLLTLPEHPAGPGVTRTPRLSVGRLTVQRARWHAAAADVPVRAADEPAAGHLLRLAAWLRAAGVPRRCYVRFTGASDDWQNQLLTKARKPMFVDFAAELLVTAFDHAVRQCGGRVSFEEELPAAAQLPWPRVTEVIVEVPA